MQATPPRVGDAVASEEEVVRVLHSPLWDRAEQRLYGLAFANAETSVCRLAISDYGTIVDVCKANLDGYADNGKARVEATASLYVHEVFSAFAAQGASCEVVADPTIDTIVPNPSHALIRYLSSSRKVPKSIERELKKLARLALLLEYARTSA